jgi:hypothetical protein
LWGIVISTLSTFFVPLNPASTAGSVALGAFCLGTNDRASRGRAGGRSSRMAGSFSDFVAFGYFAKCCDANIFEQQAAFRS